jgi:hypothetical protein
MHLCTSSILTADRIIASTADSPISRSSNVLPGTGRHMTSLALNIPLAANLLLLPRRQPLSDGAASSVAVAATAEDPAEGIPPDAVVHVPDDLEDPIRKPYAKVSSSDLCDRLTKAVVYVSDLIVRIICSSPPIDLLLLY